MATTTTTATDDINARDEKGRTKIYRAAESGDAAEVARLLDLKADPALASNEGFTPLYVASLAGQEKVVRLLIDAHVNLEAFSNNLNTPLMIAAYHGKSNVLRLLIDANANLEAVNKIGATAIYWAAERGHFNIVHILAKVWPHANVKREQPRIIKFNSLPNSCESNAHAKILVVSNKGNTTLTVAAFRGHNFVILTLIAWGLTGNESNENGRTAFHCAAYEDKPNTLKLLSAARVNENMVDFAGDTALLDAIKRNNVNCVRTLLELNVDTSMAATRANTAAEIVALLEQHKIRSLSERISTRNRILEEEQIKIQKFFKFELFEWREIHEMIVNFTIAIGHMTQSSYELMWIFNFVQLTPRLTIGDVHEDIQKLRVIDKVKASVESVHERRVNQRQLRSRNVKK